MNQALICRSLVHSWVHSCQISLYSTPNQYICSDQFSNPITHWYLSEISWQSLGLTPDSSYCEGFSLMSGRRGGSPRLNRQLYTQLISGNSNPPPSNTTHSITGGLHSQSTLNYPHVHYHEFYPLTTFYIRYHPVSKSTQYITFSNATHAIIVRLHPQHVQHSISHLFVIMSFIHSPLFISTITQWVNPHNISHSVTPHTQ